MESNYLLLIRKVDEFIRKYYKNQLIRGLLYALAALGTYYVAVVLLEYFSWFSTYIRGVLFYSFLIISSSIIGKFIAIPIVHLLRLGNIISHEQAATVIGKHFMDVKDVLLNTLQLHELESSSNESSDLIRSSIDQKINHLQPIPFTEAIDLSRNRKYLGYALPPLIFVIAALVISPSFILAPTKRILKHNNVFERPAPFRIVLLNETLQAVQQDDFTVKVKIEGDEIPAQLFIKADQANYRMEKESNVLYNFTFRNLQKNTSFIITADKYNSKEYSIRILPRPIILSFDVLADYPSYLNRPSETMPNMGDLTVPAGTKLTWKFYTRDTRKLLFRIGAKKEELQSGNSNIYTKSVRILEATPYSVIIGNAYFQNRDSLAFLVNVIPDLYPSIDVTEVKDSVYDNRLYYQGTIKDDYGLSKLTFSYSIKVAGSSDAKTVVMSKEIPIDKSLLQQQFYYYLDMSTLFIQPGDEVEYYFEVWDNDGINGNKSTRSVKRIFRVPTLDEIDRMTEKKSGEIKEKMESVIKQSKSLQHQVEEMQKKMVEKNEIGWQEKQTLKQLLEKQQSLQEQIKQIENENKEKRTQETQYKELTPEILEKQKKLEELFNQVLPDEMKKMYEELKQMLDKIDKDKVNEMLNKMKVDSKSLEKELDRNLELFKQLEVEQKLQQAIEKLDKLSDEQNKLSEESKMTEKENTDKLEEKQEDLNKQFDKLRDELNDLEKKNKELEQPNNLENTDEQEQDIQNEMNNSSQELKNKNQQNASKKQKSASDKLKKLSNKLSEMQSEMEKEETGEDVEAIKKILHYLVKISFDQEDLMNQLNVISTVNPKYLQLIQQQKSLKDDLKIVADSLYAISKRQASIEPFVLRELTTVQNNMDEAVVQMNNRAASPARAKQQYAMTSVNNLALLLSESMKKMQQSMKGGGSGKSGSQCKNPESGAGKMKSMRDLQEKLNQQLKEMRDSKQQGQNKQDNKGQQGMSEKFARMAAQQEALRKQLQEYGQQMQNETGKDSKELKEIMQKMDQTETDLVNKQLNQQTLMRQQEIVTRMLESEKAEQQRELDEKRESTEAKDIISNTAPKYQKYNTIQNGEIELLRTVPPNLKPFYKSKVNAYFLSFEK